MNWKLIVNLITFVALGLIMVFSWQDIVHVLSQLQHLNIWLIALMVPAQFLVYFCLAELFYYFFRAAGVVITLKQLYAPMIELNFVNHILPSGGVSGFSYLTLRLKHYNVSTAKSTLAQLARFAFIFVSFIALLLVALVLLAAEGQTNSLMVLIVSAITFTMLFATAILVFVVSSEHRISRFTGALARFINRVIHVFRPKHPETLSLSRVRQIFLELHEDYILIRRDPSTIRPVLLWAFATNLAELSLLYLVFIAHGEWVNPGAVIIAFAVANIAGLLAILPGGVGIYEPLMAAILISAGVPAGLAVSATLVYRVVCLLLSLLSGYVLYNKALHRYANSRISGQ